MGNARVQMDWCKGQLGGILRLNKIHLGHSLINSGFMRATRKFIWTIQRLLGYADRVVLIHMSHSEVHLSNLNCYMSHLAGYMGILGICSGYFVFKVFILRFM